MDNLTHSLVGALVAHSFPTPRSQTRVEFLKKALPIAVIASNLPDADILAGGLAGGGQLGYLLMHRGHTHTLLWALVLGALTAVPFLRKKTPPMPLLTIGIVCAWIHIFMDSWNNYGVHPFSPFSNRWFYGDFIFIVEPLIWFVLLPWLFFQSTSRWAKGFCIFAEVGMIAMVLFGLFPKPPSYTGGLIAIAGILIGTNYYLRNFKKFALPAAWTGMVFVLASFFAGSQIARTRITDLMNKTFQEEPIRDVSIFPEPANPFCWAGWVSTQNNRVHFLKISLWPSALSPDDCIQWKGAATLAYTPQPIPFQVGEPTPYWRHLGTAPLVPSKIKSLEAQNCVFDALMRFYRFPFFTKIPSGKTLVGDLRYDHEPGIGFAEVVLDETPTCSFYIPPWNKPFVR